MYRSETEPGPNSSFSPALSFSVRLNLFFFFRSVARECQCKDRGARRELAEPSAIRPGPCHRPGKRNARPPPGDGDGVFPRAESEEHRDPCGHPTPRQVSSPPFTRPLLRFSPQIVPTGTGIKPDGSRTHALCPTPAAAPGVAFYFFFSQQDFLKHQALGPNVQLLHRRPGSALNRGVPNPAPRSHPGG